MRCLYLSAFIGCLITDLAMAENGSLPIGSSAASRALGGTGIAAFTGVVDSEYKNPATLSQLPKASGQAELSLGFFSVDAQAQQKVTNPVLQGDDTGRYRSSATRLVAPTAIGVAYRVTEDLALALGASAFGSQLDYGDHRGVSGVKRTTSQINLMLAASYQLCPEVSIGATLIGQSFASKSSLLYSKAQFARTEWNSTGKAGSAAVGARYSVTPMVTVGVSYMLPKTAKLKGFLDADTYNADYSPNTVVNHSDIKVSDPKEIGIGTQLRLTTEWTVLADFKRLLWASDSFYKDLGWRDQNIFAVGSAYTTGVHTWKAGFNYAKMPMPKSLSGDNGLEPVRIQGHLLSKLNVAILNTLVLPATSEQSYTLGSSHALTDSITVNTALVYNPPSSVTRSGVLQEPTGAVGSYNYEAKLSLTALTLDATIKF